MVRGNDHMWLQAKGVRRSVLVCVYCYQKFGKARVVWETRLDQFMLLKTFNGKINLSQTTHHVIFCPFTCPLLPPWSFFPVSGVTSSFHLCSVSKKMHSCYCSSTSDTPVVAVFVRARMKWLFCCSHSFHLMHFHGYTFDVELWQLSILWLLSPMDDIFEWPVHHCLPYVEIIYMYYSVCWFCITTKQVLCSDGGFFLMNYDC